MRHVRCGLGAPLELREKEQIEPEQRAESLSRCQAGQSARDYKMAFKMVRLVGKMEVLKWKLLKESVCQTWLRPGT